MSYFVPLNDTEDRTTPPPNLMKVSSNSLDTHNNMASPVPDPTVSSMSSPDSGTNLMHISMAPDDILSSASELPFMVTAEEGEAIKSYDLKSARAPLPDMPMSSHPHDFDDDDANHPDGTRRQNRLQRNRESARMSRRRRKQYLEILEDKVHSLGEDLDRARRQHVDVAVAELQSQRAQMIAKGVTIPAAVSRVNQELMVTQTFQREQLRALTSPASAKLVAWLTLQNDEFYHGGRRPSERLSAARIGERLLQSGEDKAGPSDSLWPLFCNEINLSYDQEEKVRALQRGMLQTPESWLDRHVVFASDKVTQSTHDAVQALSLRAGQREASNHAVLSDEQRVKLAAWSSRNKSRTAKLIKMKVAAPPKSAFELNRESHPAANMYVVNHKMESVLDTIPRAAPPVTGSALKKFSRRPLFEPLSGMDSKNNKKEEQSKALSRVASYTSSGSLKRNASEMIMDIDSTQLTPIELEATAATLVERKLGHLKEIIPVRSFVSSLWTDLPAPTPVAALMTRQVQSVPNFATHQDDEPAPKHQRQGSFLPAHLSAVPESQDFMFFNDEGADADILATLVDDNDWDVGVGMSLDLE